MTSVADTREMLEVMEAAARLAGDGLLSHFRALAADSVEFKGRRELVTFADREAERTLVEAVRAHWPGHAVLAEEGAMSPRGKVDFESESVWVIDPLDGTTNFVHGHPFFSVSIGLSVAGEPRIGIVHAPALRETYTAARGLGTSCNGRPVSVTKTETLRDALVATGFSYIRNEAGAETNVGAFGRVLMECRDLRRCGSAALDLAYVAAGRYDAYWERDLAPYDVLGGAVLVMEAGGAVTDFAGGSAWTSGRQIVATNGLVHRELLAVVTAGG